MPQPKHTLSTEISTAIIERMLRQMPEPGDYPTDIPGFTLHRRDEAHKPENCFFNPAITVLVQGHKQTVIGSEEYTYGEGQCLINSLDLPSTNFITDASPEKPFLVLALQINRHLTTELAAAIPKDNLPTQRNRNISIADVNGDVLDAFTRLLGLLDKPEQVDVLAPLIIREIHYRMLTGPQGSFLREVNSIGSPSHQIAQAIDWLKVNFNKNFVVEELARQVNLSTSTFHRHFKEITSLSPVQYQKRLRLYEAQRLMLAENEYAANACLAVGYESHTQFSREYKRMFGESPGRDVINKRRELAVTQ